MGGAVANADIERIVQRQFELLAEGKRAEAAATFSDDAINNGLHIGRSGVEAVLRALGEAFPDQRHEIVEMVSDGELVASRVTMTGTHLGMPSVPFVVGGVLAGVEPTQRRVEVAALHMHRIRDGKIIEHFAVRDDLGMGRQLGLLPEGPPRRLP
jgi:predicted ester cyclase